MKSNAGLIVAPFPGHLLLHFLGCIWDPLLSWPLREGEGEWGRDRRQEWGRDGRQEWGTVGERKGRGKGEGRWEELAVAFHGVGMFIVLGDSIDMFDSIDGL